MGTRFYASQEAEGHPQAKQRIVAAGSGQTVRSIVFDLSRQIRWPAQYTGRLLRNRHAETWLGREDELAARMVEVGRDYATARERGDFDIAGVIAGEACALIHDIPPAGEIVERIIKEAEQLLARHQGLGVGRGSANVRFVPQADISHLLTGRSSPRRIPYAVWYSAIAITARVSVLLGRRNSSRIVK